MVAVVVTALTLVAIVSLVGSTVSNTTFSRDRTQAARLTGEALEWIRAERDFDWPEFAARGSATGTTYCLNSLAWNFAGSCGGGVIQDTVFTREVTLIYDAIADPDRVEIRIVTTWNDSAGSHESRLSTYLTNWRTN